VRPRAFQAASASVLLHTIVAPVTSEMHERLVTFFLDACHGGPVGLSLAGAGTPTPPSMLRVGPSPFAGSTHIELELTETARIRLHVFDVGGRSVRKLVRGVHGPGTVRLEWDGRSDGGEALRPGVYFLRLESGGRSESRAVVRLW